MNFEEILKKAKFEKNSINLRNYVGSLSKIFKINEFSGDYDEKLDGIISLATIISEIPEQGTLPILWTGDNVKISIKFNHQSDYKEFSVSLEQLYYEGYSYPYFYSCELLLTPKQIEELIELSGI